MHSQDSTFEFEKRRNRPVKYDRDLMGTTLRAMKRVSQIRAAREKRFYDNRYSVAMRGWEREEVFRREKEEGAMKGAPNPFLEIVTSLEIVVVRRRMKSNKARQKAEVRAEIAQNIDLVAPAASRTKAKAMVLETVKTATKDEKTSGAKVAWADKKPEL